jgi:hypothetical protein
MEEHYLTQKHQEIILKFVPEMRSQLPDSEMDIDLSRTTTTTASSSATTKLHKVHETLNILKRGIETLKNNTQRLGNEILQFQINLQTLTSVISPLKISVEESDSSLNEPKLNQANISQRPTITNEKSDDNNCTSYDGTLTWEITNFKEKMSR